MIHRFTLLWLLGLLLTLPARLRADGYTPDILRPDYARLTIALPADGDAVPPVCTLVRHAPPAHARAALLYVHGYNDYFFQSALGDTATRRGYAFYAIDLRDYGRSIRPGRDPFYTDDLRDYRFYANILYDGSTYNGHVMDIHYTREGNNEIPGEDLTAYGTSTTAAVTRTGYYMGKFVNEKQQINNDEAYASSQNYIIWRYAEVLLDYAEVMFRLGNTEAARTQVNAIRRRAHMDELPSLTWEQLVNERRVELAFEETSYWDIFRWGIAEEKLNGSSNPIKAMKIVHQMNGDITHTVSNMDRFPTRVRVFQKMQYYLPIPWDEIRYHEIEQNPEWVEV